MVINDLSGIKQKVFTFRQSLNRRVHLFPSKIHKYAEFRYTCVDNTYTFNKRMRDFQYHTKDFRSINYNDSVIGSNIQYYVMIQPGETVSAS